MTNLLIPLSHQEESVEIATTAISNILLQRDADECRAIASSTKTIQNLPSPVVGEIASSLPQKYYARFSTTNQQIYVDCQSPNRLYKLSLSNSSNDTVALGNYPKIEFLILPLRLISVWDNNLISNRCRRLRILCLILDVEDMFLKYFIDQNNGGFPNVNKLVIIRKSRKLTSLSFNRFVELLSLFPNLNFLRLKSIYFSTPVVAQQLRDLCVNIKQLYLRGVRDEVIFLQSLSPTLDTLTWSPWTVKNLSVDWFALQRLCLLAPPNRVMEQALEKANGLKQICFFPNIRTRRKQPMTDTEIEVMAKKLFTDYLSLDFIYISTRAHFERICNAIHQGLYQTQNLKRENLEIGLHLDCSEIKDLTDFMCNISKILAVLNASKTKTWTLTLQRHKKYNFKQMAKRIRNYIGSYPGSDMTLLHHSWSKLIIGNSTCISLHRHWWNDCIKPEYY